MKNVLSIVSYPFLPPKMGGQKGIAFFNDHFCKHVNLTCITTQNNDSSFAKGYEVNKLLSNSFFRYINVLYFFNIRKIIRQKEITHLVIEHPYYGWLGILLKLFCNVKLIVHSHNIESLRFKSTGRWWWRILWNYEMITYSKADTCFFITDEDRLYAIKEFKLTPEKCTTITYGFELNAPPSGDEKKVASDFLQKSYGIGPEETILLFNGTLAYKPNLDALKNIIDKINPLLLNDKNFRYRIIICGKGLPDELNNLDGYKDQHIIYAGFVDDINIYFRGADIFINPVIEGGGIKTKLVEALGYNMSVITTASGAIGVPQNITGNKMKIIKDNDWQEFALQTISVNTAETIPSSFFEHFFWDNIAAKAAQCIG